MGFFDSLLKKAPPLLEAEITYVSGASGMLTTSDKQALSFSVVDCEGFKPAERQKVRIGRVDGMRALALTWVADLQVPTFDPEARYASYQLTILLEKTLPRDAATLRSLLAGGALGTLELSSQQAMLDVPSTTFS